MVADGGKPLITTECWSVVDYKDWPLLEWGWIKELCEHGVRTRLRDTADGPRWRPATSAARRFSGMWRDVAWHRRMTDLIHSTPLPMA